MDSAIEPTHVAASEPTRVAATKSTAAASARFCGGRQQSGCEHGRCNRHYQSFHDFTPVQQRHLLVIASGRSCSDKQQVGAICARRH
jgi:hypothetical protein